MSRLEGKVGVIAGAASGIGRASALRFSKEGAAVVIADLNVAGGEEVAHECIAQDGRAAFIRTEVSEEPAIKAAVDLAVRKFGKLDVIFNNAGVGGATGPIEATTLENWDRTQAILVRSVFLGMKYAVPELRQAGGGSIISTASVAGLAGSYGPHSYSAAKSAVINLTRSATIELGKDRIRVNAIRPGRIVTPLLYGRLPGDGKALIEQRMAEVQPIRRAGRPEHIANVALFLASDEAEWITGTTLVVDGGLTAGSRFFEQTGPQVSSELSPRSFAGPSCEK